MCLHSERAKFPWLRLKLQYPVSIFIILASLSLQLLFHIYVYRAWSNSQLVGHAVHQNKAIQKRSRSHQETKDIGQLTEQ